MAESVLSGTEYDGDWDRTFVKRRDELFPIVRAAARCNETPSLESRCERGECMCARIACAVADRLASELGV